MAENSFNAFTGALTGLFVVWALRAMLRAAKSGKRRADSEGRLCLGYGKWFRGLLIFGAVLFVSFVVAAVVVVRPKNEVGFRVMLVAFLPFVLLTACGLWEVTRFLLLISPEGLACRSPWRGWQFAAWKDVAEFSYSGSGSCFVLSASDRRCIRVPIYISGICQFLDECEKRLPWTMMQKAQKGYAQLARPIPSGED